MQHWWSLTTGTWVWGSPPCRGWYNYNVSSNRPSGALYATTCQHISVAPFFCFFHSSNSVTTVTPDRYIATALSIQLRATHTNQCNSYNWCNSVQLPWINATQRNSRNYCHVQAYQDVLVMISSKWISDDLILKMTQMMMMRILIKAGGRQDPLGSRARKRCPQLHFAHSALLKTVTLKSAALNCKNVALNCVVL